MTVDWDIALKTWAVLGPLLAAAVSAVWARRVQLADRAHDDQKEKLRFDREHMRSEAAIRRDKRQRRYSELKDAVMSVLGCSHQYVLKQSEQLSSPSPENKASATAVFDDFIRQAQVVLVFGDEELEKATINFWNLIAGIPRAYSAPASQEYQDRLTAYKEARLSFTVEAKRVLTMLQDEV